MNGRRVLLIIGAMRGIGKALAIAVAGEGYDVALNYRSNLDEAEALIAKLGSHGGRAIAVQGNLSVAADADRLVRETVERLGRLDCLVNNAGLGERIEIAKLDEVAFERTLRVNLTGAFLVSQAAWPHMTARGGRLVFLSSGAARTGGAISAAYAASKAGLEGLMHYYATRLRPHRITANAIAPALIESDMTRAMDLPLSDELPMGRLGRADEIWPALRMILETEYLTGQTIHVDAGRYMT